MIIHGMPIHKCLRDGQIVYKLAPNAPVQHLTPQLKAAINLEIQKMVLVDRQPPQYQVQRAPAFQRQVVDPRQMALQRHSAEVKAQVVAKLKIDHERCIKPNLAPFKSVQDAQERLQAYHIYQYTDDELSHDEEAFKRRLSLNQQFFDRKVGEFNQKFNLVLRKNAENERLNEFEVLICEKLLLRDDKQRLTREVVAPISSTFDPSVMEQDNEVPTEAQSEAQESEAESSSGESDYDDDDDDDDNDEDFEETAA